MAKGTLALRGAPGVPPTLQIARERYAAGELGFAQVLATALADQQIEPLQSLTLAGRAALRRSDADAVERIAERLREIGPQGRRTAAALEGALAGRSGDLGRARALLEPMLADEPAAAKITYDLALAYWNARQLDEAEALLQHSEPSASGLDGVALAQLRGWIEVRRERYPAALRFFDEALRRYAALDDRDEWLLARTLQAASALSMEMLDLPMLPRLEEYAARDAAGESREPLFHATQNVGWLVMLAGRAEDALEYFERARSLAPTPALASVAYLNIATYHRVRSNRSVATQYLHLSRAHLGAQRWSEANVDERMTLLEYALEAYHLEPQTAGASLTRYLSHTKKRQGNLAFEDDPRAVAIELTARGLLEAIHGRRANAIDLLRAGIAIWARLGYRYREALTALLLDDVGEGATWLGEAEHAAASVPKSWLRDEIARRGGLAATGIGALTPAQRRVMLAICEGKTSKQIATEFGRSFHTIRNQTLKVYDAMGVRSRSALIAECARLGIVGKA
jgi:DNA-binding CsgD family transcriptional regulator/tetratricopeptide (TPR) repeat protein